MDNLSETPPGNANCQIEVGGQVGGGQAGIFPVYTEKKESKKKQPRTLRTGLECTRWELSHAPREESLRLGESPLGLHILTAAPGALGC